jgi:hypothetical protein
MDDGSRSSTRADRSCTICPNTPGRMRLRPRKPNWSAKLVEALGVQAKRRRYSVSCREPRPKIGKAFFFGDGEVLGRS